MAVSMQDLLATPVAAKCMAFVERIMAQESISKHPSVVALSIALGALEFALTVKDESLQRFPQDLEVTVQQLSQLFDAFVAEMAERLRAAAGTAAGALNDRAKIKLVADTVWSKLTAGSFSKDVLHAQHLYNFTSLLLPPGSNSSNGKAARRQLDCAGVVTTCYAVCNALATQHGHSDLAGVRMQVSEDHCWLQLTPPGSSSEALRQGSVEVTTVNPAQRALAATPQAWRGWLYNGGGAVLCSPHQALAAVVASLDPQVVPGKKGRDSELLQAVQWRLLSLLQSEHPGCMYPAAVCALADLLEVERQDALDVALEATDEPKLRQLLQRQPGDSQALFERAIFMASGQQQTKAAAPVSDLAAGQQAQQQAGNEQPPKVGQEAAAVATTCNGGTEAAAAFQAAADAPGSSRSSAGMQYYPHSYLAGFLHRRADFLGKCAAAFPASQASYLEAALAALKGGLEAAAASAGVLGKYEFQPSTDEQLFKDVEGVLEYCCDGLKAYHHHQQPSSGTANGSSKGTGNSGALIDDASLLRPLLQFWDGCCLLFAGRPKPSNWVALVIKTAKLFSSNARAAAAANMLPCSGPMQSAQRLWEALKPASLKPIFETADVGSGAAAIAAAVGGEDALEQSSGGRAAKRQRS